MKLTRDEIILVGGVLLAIVLGATVKHYRDASRIAPLSAKAPAHPSPLPKETPAPAPAETE